VKVAIGVGSGGGVPRAAGSPAAVFGLGIAGLASGSCTVASRAGAVLDAVELVVLDAIEDTFSAASPFPPATPGRSSRVTGATARFWMLARTGRAADVAWLRLRSGFELAFRLGLEAVARGLPARGARLAFVPLDRTAGGRPPARDLAVFFFFDAAIPKSSLSPYCRRNRCVNRYGLNSRILPLSIRRRRALLSAPILPT
jgi:hypothetical protein